MVLIAGDVVYNQCHMYVGDITPESRKNWVAALDRLAALKPAIAGESGAPRRTPCQPDDRALPQLGSQPVVVDVRIPERVM
jgi:hypothetical protein